MGCGNVKPVSNDKKPAAQHAKSGSRQPLEKERSVGSSQNLSNTNGKLLDKYSLGKVLGQGAFGVVYKCKKKNTDEEFAVKMIDQVETPLIEIKREADMLLRLAHPTVIKLHDVYYEKVFVCLVLDYIRGGDMIQGMMAHWKTKGMIPIPPVRNLSKQMHTSVAYLHSKECIHRDVKGDNFMMDRPHVETEGQRLYLSDFGTVLDCKPEQRINQKCGTKNYWPPEFFSMNYGMKVDCWAVGVVMFGLVSGKFPFKGEEDVRSKKLAIPSRCPADGQELIKHLLERDEEKRWTCKQALTSTFVDDQAVGSHSSEVGGTSSEFVPDIRETGANAGIAQRRAELVERLQKADGKKKKQAVDAGSVQPYSVLDPATERTMHFQWQKASAAEHLTKAFEKARPVTDADLVNYEVTEESVRQQLTDHNVNMKGFGKAPAKSFGAFVAEIQNGSCRLLLDATKHKCLVRAVDIVLMRITHGSGPNKRILVTQAALPGSVQSAQENFFQAAERIRKDMLGIGSKVVTWDLSASEAFEEVEQSPQYPGITTVYRKEIMVGTISASDPKSLNRLGLGGPNRFDYTSGGVTRTFEWLDEKTCADQHITIKAKKDHDFSALVYPPIGLEEEELKEFMKINSIDTSEWGQGTWKTLEEFSEELVKGESTLIKQANKQVVRVVDIVVLQLTRKDTGHILLEEKETYRDSTMNLGRLPAVKRRSDEHQFHTARRMVSKHLKLDECRVEIGSEVKIIEEESQSLSYKGISSIYRKRFMKGVLLPDGIE